MIITYLIYGTELVLIPFYKSIKKFKLNYTQETLLGNVIRVIYSCVSK